MEVFANMVLFMVLIITTIYDLKFYRIPNQCVLIGIITGLILHPDRIGISLIQMVIIFLVFYPFFLMKGIGAGDIKLMMMLGSYFDKDILFKIVAISFVIGGFIALLKIAFTKQAKEQLVYGIKYIRKIIKTKCIDPYETNKANKNKIVRLSLPISIATLLGGMIL